MNTAICDAYPNLVLDINLIYVADNTFTGTGFKKTKLPQSTGFVLLIKRLLDAIQNRARG